MYTSLENKILQLGLVDIQSLDQSIEVDLKYMGKDNFMGEVLYKNIYHAFLVEELAQRVVRAYQALLEIDKAYRIIIYDAARPLSIQQKMFNKVKGTPWEVYVANPNKKGSVGGFHNYGMAVDLSIKLNGNVLDMGSPFDSFDATSHTDIINFSIEENLVKTGKISLAAYHNRRLLYKVMGEQALFPIPKEWWHFQYHRDDEDKKRFKLLDF